MAIRLKHLSEWFFEKGGPRLTLIFVASDDAASVAMAEQAGLARPSSPRIVASWTAIDEQRFRGVDEFVRLDARRPLRSLLQLRRSLLSRRIDRAVLRFNPGEPLVRRWGVALITADLLIFNADGESYEPEQRHPLAAWRFLRGEPVADLGRPARFAFLREWLESCRVWLLLADEFLARRRKTKIAVAAFTKSRPGCSVLCLPGIDGEQLDAAVWSREEAEIVATNEALLPEAELVEQLRRRLQQKNVWLVCTRASFKHLLGEGWAPHRPHENGTFCLGATSSLFAFRRDVYLELGGLSPYEKQLPRHGWAALSLRAWLRGYRTIYAGDIEFRALRAPAIPAPFAGPPLAPLVAACDDLATRKRLLHRYGRLPEFRASYRQAIRNSEFPAVQGKLNGQWAALAEEGAMILEGCRSPRPLRVAVVAPELPYPPVNSATARLHHLLRRLSAHAEIYLFAFAEKTSDSQIETLLEYCTRLVVIRPEPAAAPRRLPGGIERYQSALMERHLQALLPDFDVHLVQIETAKLAMALRWVDSTHIPKLISMTGLPSATRSQMRNSPMGRQRKFPGRDARRWRQHERKELGGFDGIAMASEAALDELRQRMSPAHASVVPNGVDCEYFRRTQPEPDSEEVLVIAEFDDVDNIAAFDVLVRTIWPQVLGARPAAQLTAVAGADFRIHWRRRFRQSLPAFPNVTMLGHVGDFRPLYEHTCVVAAPALAANGASLRILEALAMKRAVVATRAARAGLPLEAGRDFLAADEPGQFATAISELLVNRELRLRLGENGRALVEADHDWDRAVKQLLETYGRLLKNACPR